MYNYTRVLHERILLLRSRYFSLVSRAYARVIKYKNILCMRVFPYYSYIMLKLQISYVQHSRVEI